MTDADKVDKIRWYSCGGVTLQVESDLPFNPETFHSKFESFRVDGPGEETAIIRHHFALPELDLGNLGECAYRKAPWAVYKQNGSWTYIGILPRRDEREPYLVATFSEDHWQGHIHHRDDSQFRKGGLRTLTGFASDQILLARVLAQKEGCYLHSSGIILEGLAMLFVGMSGAGKSTLMKMVSESAVPLCDDRNIVRPHEDGYWAYGTWSHGELPIVSASSAPLHAIFFLEQATENRLVPIPEGGEAVRRLLESLIRPLETKDWWEKVLRVIEGIAREVPCYVLGFDLSGGVAGILRELVERKGGIR